MTSRPPWILPTIIISQFAGTSLWFASNAVLADLQRQWNLESSALSYMTSAVQFGFIAGTLCFAFFAIADRFSPRWVFFGCSVLGALSNVSMFAAQGFYSLMVLRFLTGFFLAGIYPVGMKIAAGWYREGLGNALGFLVGALVLGTAFPHLLKGWGQTLPWEQVILLISGVALLGGILMLWLVPDGPFLFKGTRFNSKALFIIFQSKDLRSASFGYFGHMWEIYTLWAFIPLWLAAYAQQVEISLNISLWSFGIIAAGSLGCMGGGILSRRFGSAQVAFFQLCSSGICCALSPWLFGGSPEWFLGFLLFWGMVAAGDSPQFSALTAQAAPREYVGSALTIVTCIGFSITIVSIQLLNFLLPLFSPSWLFLLLTVGPVFGLIALKPLVAIPRSQPK